MLYKVNYDGAKIWEYLQNGAPQAQKGTLDKSEVVTGTQTSGGFVYLPAYDGWTKLQWLTAVEAPPPPPPPTEPTIKRVTVEMSDGAIYQGTQFTKI